MSSATVTRGSTSEARPPMFCCCYNWKYPKLTAIDMLGQDVIPGRGMSWRIYYFTVKTDGEKFYTMVHQIFCMQ